MFAARLVVVVSSALGPTNVRALLSRLRVRVPVVSNTFWVLVADSYYKLF
jgi:hypothetical protein